MRTRHNKRDENEPVIIDAAEQCGIHWLRQGPLDLWCFRQGRWVPVEIKKPERSGHKDEFRQSQKDFMALCDRIGAPYLVWRTRDDVIQDANLWLSLSLAHRTRLTKAT